MLITLCRKLALPAVQLLLGLLLTLGMAWAQPIPLSVAVVKNKMLAAVKAGDAANAIELGEQWLVNANKVPVPNREEQAEIMSQLGEAYFAAGQYEQAEIAVRQAISTSEKIKRLQNVESVKSLVKRASSHLIAGETEKAFPFALTGLVLTEKVTPLNLDAMGDALDVMGRIYSALGQPALALRYFQNEIDISEIHFGVEHTSTSLALNNLAVTYGELAEHEKALPLQLRALSIWEKVMGPDHPDTATSLDNLAATYREMAQYEKMLPLHQRALAIRDRVLGPEHPDTATSLDNLAAAYIVMAQYEKALPLQLRALAIRENVLGPEHPDTALSLNILAATYGALAQHEKALPLEVRALAIREKALGSEHPDTALSLNNLAETYRVLAQYEKALPLQLRALLIREKVFGSNHPTTAQSLSNLAMTFSAQGQSEKALPLQLRALAIREKVLGPEHPDTAVNLINLAGIYRDLARYDKTLPLELRAIAIQEKMLGSEHPGTAQSLNNLAGTYGALAQHEEALPLQLRALAIRERVLGPEHPDTAQSLSNLAGIYHDLAHYEKALPLELRAIAIQEKMLGSEHPNVARSLNNLAGTYGALAQHEKALPVQLHALAIREKVLGPEHPDTAQSLNNLAGTYGALAQHEKALPLQVRALAIREKALGSEHPDTALSLNNLAVTYDALAQHGNALPVQLRALAIREKVLGPEHPDTAQSLNNLALTYSAMGQLEKTLSLQLRALAILENVSGPEHPDTALYLSNLAATFGVLTQHENALPVQLRALAISEKVLGYEHPDTALRLSNLSWIYQHAGSPTLAIGLLKQAINIYQRQRERIATIGTNELNSYTDSINGNYQALARQLTDQGRLAEAQQVLDMLKEDEVFEFVRRSSTADPRRTRVAYTPTEAQWLGRYREIADRLGALGAEEQALQKQAKQGLTPAQEARLKALQTDLAVAEKAFLAFLGDLQKDLSAQGPVRAAEVAEASERAQRELQTLVRGMGPDVALLQYYITTDRVGMILTTPGSVQAFNTPVDAKELNRHIAAYRAVLRTPAADTLPGAQALYRLLVAPVAPTLERAGVKTIMLSLDGNLRHLPFGALHDGKQYLAQRWQLPLYTAVVKDKLRDAVSPHWNTAGLGVTKALGDFKALPAVKGELAGVLRANTGNAGTKGELFLDEDFTATRLKDVGQRNFQLMHVSSHFQLSPGTEINSFLLLGDGTRLTLGDMRNQNYRFDQVDLLTLAACDTGLGGGRDANGKEIEGLGVLAQQQGARAVLATLWPVADQSTATLMADMYQRRQAQGLSKAEALRQAQLALMAQPKYAHPFYWAPFILMGNWK